MTIGVSKFKKLEQYFRDKFEDFIRLFDEHSERPAAQTQQKLTQVSLPQPSPPPPPGYKTLFAQEFLACVASKGVGVGDRGQGGREKGASPLPFLRLSRRLRNFSQTVQWIVAMACPPY